MLVKEVTMKMKNGDRKTLYCLNYGMENIDSIPSFVFTVTTTGKKIIVPIDDVSSERFEEKYMWYFSRGEEPKT